MEAVQSGLQLSGWSKRDAMNENAIRVELPAPGQRGAMQMIIQSKRELQLIKPHMTRVMKVKPQIEREAKKRYELRQKLVRQTHRLQGYCNKILARANDIEAAAELAIKTANTGQPKKRQSTKKDPNRQDKMEIDTMLGDDDYEIATSNKKASAHTLAGPNDQEVVDIIKVLGNIVDGINGVLTCIAEEDEFIEKMLEPEAVIKQCDQLTGELKRQIETVTSLTRSIMGTQFNRDAKTAVGRGPPGHIAFSPFTANDPLFERDDVMQVIIETNRRNGKV